MKRKLLDTVYLTKWQIAQRNPEIIGEHEAIQNKAAHSIASML